MRERKRIALFIDYAETEYSQKVVAGANLVLKERGYDILIFPTGGGESLVMSYDYQYLSVAAHINAMNVDGVIFVTTQALNYYEQEFVESYIKSFSSIPTVSIGYIYGSIPSIFANSDDAMRELVSHLIAVHKRKRFALLDVAKGAQDVQSRRQVFFDVLAEYGIDIDKDNVLIGNFGYYDAFQALEDYRRRKGGFDFDAVVALNDEMAFACIDCLKKYGIRVPEDVVVTGFDNNNRAMLGAPPLTTVDQNIELQAALAADKLCNVIENKSYELITAVHSRAVYRQSCGCLKLEDGFFKERGSSGAILNSRYDDKGFGLAEWHVRRGEFTQAIKMFTSMQVNDSLDEFRSHLNSDMVTFGIESAAIVLFENPINMDKEFYFTLPDSAMVFTAMDGETGFTLDDQSPPVKFHPRKQILPDYILSSLDGMYVVSLFRNSILYGYMLFRPGRFDITVYTMVCRIISNNLASSYSLSKSLEEKKELTDKFSIVHAISVTDEMTGLLNRRGFLSLAEKALDASESSQGSGIVLYGDIDGLKKINDSYGHAAGDKAIIAEAQLLKKHFRSTDVIGRMGGDEFAIVAPSLGIAKYQEIRRNLDKACADWNKESGAPFILSISLGYVSYPIVEAGADGYDLKKLLNLADNALYFEKRGKHCLRQD
ncbi:MAG: GGDEF domain-containing protein [Treponema sp.]|nr:GGDEF domain-containing protein [Treponema sp.]